MAKIDSLGVSSFVTGAASLSQSNKKEEKTHSVKKEKFTTLLQKSESEIAQTGLHSVPIEIQDKNYDEALQFLLDAVYNVGDQLKKKPYSDIFIEYKKALSQFIGFVLDNSYEVESFEQQKRFNRKKFTLVTVINKKLDSLASDILYNQKDQLKILEKINEINGILIDFFS